MIEPFAHQSPIGTALTLLRARHGQAILLPPGPDATAFMKILASASNHGVAAALAGGLRCAGGKDEAWSRLQAFVDDLERYNAARNRAFHAAAMAISQSLAGIGIPCAFLKGGAFLIEEVADWRTLSDIDILVAPNDIARASDLLLAEGYRPAASAKGYTDRNHHHCAPLVHPQTDIMVELHRRLMQAPRDNWASPRDILAAARRVDGTPEHIFIPSPEDRMIHMIAHAQNSNWGYTLRRIVLKDLLDAVELSIRNDLDWNRVRGAFIATGTDRELRAFLLAAHRLLGLQLPFPETAFHDVCRWADDALNGLHHHTTGWRTSARIASRYTRLFASNPRRLGMVWTTIAEGERRDNLLGTTLRRMGAAAVR